MPKFEVHIPATDSNGFNVTLKVGAENWMAALKAGMQKLGEQGTVSQNVMVDIQEDNSIHVTEPASGRVFRIRELSEEEAAKAQVKRPSQIRPAPQPPQAPPSREVKTEPGLPAIKVDRADLNKTQPMPPAVVLPPKKSSDLEVTAKGGEPLKIEKPDLTKTLPPDAPAVPRNATPAPRSHKPSTRLEVKDVEELVQPVKMPTGNIGRV
ncbi:MAG TPA: hypothetical protein VGD87_14180, partial [Archangium sp.]